MKKKSKLLVVLLLCISLLSTFVLSGCLDDEEDYDRETQSSTATSTAATNTTNENSAVMNLAYGNIIRSPQQTVKGNSEDTFTILVYMNGSDLESDGGAATEDLKEMIAAGGSDKVNILVQTMGTKKWEKDLGIASDRSQIYCINKDGFNLVKDDLGQLDCTIASTLKNFISWGVSNYPADRYALIFWNHGGGPVYGFGSDEYQGEYDALTIDEMQSALTGAGVYFDFIGMDCCIMSCLEVCCALYDFCDYTILSEDFESGIGWEYTTWLKDLYNNTSISTLDLGKSIVDSMVSANVSEGESAILSVIDEGVMQVLYSSWINFAYANEDSLINSNYSEKRTRSTDGRVHPILIKKGFFSSWLSDEEDVTLSEYYISDIMAIAQNVDSDESQALSTAIARAIVYMNSTEYDTTMTGLSITLPYGDSEFYDELKTVFANCGFDSEYIAWLEKFVDAEGSDSFYDYDDWDDEWSGWDDYDDDYDWEDDDWSLFDFIFGDDDYDDDYDWDSDYGWSNWDYDDSWNEWYDNNDGYYDDWDDDYQYDDWGDGDYNYGNWDW